MNTTDPSRPDFTRPEVVAYRERLQLVRDFVGGTDVVHARAARYIRKWKDEDPKVFAIRSTCEEVDEGTQITLNAAVGMIFSHPPTITWNAHEDLLKPHWDNIDGAGTIGHVAAKRFGDDGFQDGVGAILVDHPSPPLGEDGEPVQVTAANEEALGLRPTWSFYPRSAVINWRHEVVGGRETLSMVVFREVGQEPDGPFGVREVKRYRVLRLLNGAAQWTLYREEKDAKGELSFPVERSGFLRNRTGQPCPHIPAAIAYTGRYEAPMVAAVPLLPVAQMNLGHWRQATNLRFYREVASFPQPKLKGSLEDEIQGQQRVPGKFKIGPMVLVRLKENGDFSWEELEGKSMDQVEKGVTEKLRQMARAGLSFLNPETRREVTAEAKRMDAVAQNATLATAAQGIEDAINMAWEFHCWYLGIPKTEAPVVTLNRDFEGATMSPQEMAAWATLAEKANIPPEQILKALQAGGKIPRDADLNKIALEMELVGAINSERRRVGLAADLDEAGEGLAA